MVGLGIINPFAALIPLIAPSNNKPLPCNQLFAQIRQHPVAPPPGQKMRAAPLPGSGAKAVAPSASHDASRNAGNAHSGAAAQPGLQSLYRGS